MKVEKGVWPGSSPDLNPIENLWSLLKGKVDEFESVTTTNELNIGYNRHGHQLIEIL